MRKFLSWMLCLTLLFGCFGLGVSAEEVIYPKVSHGYTATEDLASDAWTVDNRGAYLGSGMSTIARRNSTSINISGVTTCTRVCDTVQLTLVVDRSKSYATGYSGYEIFTYSADNVYQLGKEISNIPVERGYYYRVRGIHSVVKDGVRETTDSVTDPLDYR